MFLGPLHEVLILSSGQSGGQNLLGLVVLQPYLGYLLGALVSNQFQLHDVGELLVRQFSRLLSLQLLLGIEKLGVGPGMGWV